MKTTPASRRLAKKIGRKLPVGRTTQIHTSSLNYNRRINRQAIEIALSEMDGEGNMKDYARAKVMAKDVFNYLVGRGANATRLVDTEPPVIEVFGITDEVLTITVDVKDNGK